jgi:hypothetical protein
VEALLAEYELWKIVDLSRGADLLAKLQTRFPHDPRVQIVSCFAANSPDSIWLTLLEGTEPDNALPSLLRAGYWASHHNSEEMAKEVTRALSKKALTTHLRERQIALLNLALSQGNDLLPQSHILALDRGYFDSLTAIRAVLAANPSSFGNEDHRIAMAMELSAKLDQMDGYAAEHTIMSEAIEAALLQGVSIDHSYGSKATTVRQRLEQMQTDLRRIGAESEQIGVLILNDVGDASLRLQYYTRVRDEGQDAATNWLMNLQK